MADSCIFDSNNPHIDRDSIDGEYGYTNIDYGILNGFINYDRACDLLFKHIRQGDLAKVEAVVTEIPMIVNVKTLVVHNTALMCAASQGTKSIIELLISKGADINAINSEGWNAAMGAINLPQHLELLISKGININVRGSDDSTLLMWAAYYHEKKSVELLIAGGINNINAKNKEGKTALMIAEAFGYNDIADILRQHGAKE